MQLQALPNPVIVAGQAEASFKIPRTGASDSSLQLASAYAKSDEFPSITRSQDFPSNPRSQDGNSNPRSNNSQASSFGSHNSRENSSQSLTVKTITDNSDPRSSNIMPTLEEESASEVGRTRTQLTGFSGFMHNSIGSFSPRLSKLYRYWKFFFLRLLAGVSPLIIFTLLCAGYGCETMAKFSAGASAFVVLWFISLTKAPRKIVHEDELTTKLFEFSDEASNANHADFKDLLALATDDELDALCVLVELARPWQSKAVERTNSQSFHKGISRKSYSWGSGISGSVAAVAQNTIPTLSRKSGSLETAGTSSPSKNPHTPSHTPPISPVERVGRSWSNLSAGSRKVKFGNNVQAGSTEATDYPRSILKARQSNESLNSNLLRPSFSEISLSSFSDFQRRGEPVSGVSNLGTPLALELDLPGVLSEFRSEGAEQKPQSNRHRFRMPGGAGSFLGVDHMKSLQSEAPSNASALSYHSACDAVLGDVDKPSGELVSAEIAGVGQGSNGMTRVRIEFRSQCLRTQNEWQKSLLQQQKTLLKAVNTKLKKTQQELSHVKTWADDMHEDQKVLLRSFRKIIPRELGDLDDMDEIKERVVVIIIDEDENIRTSSQKMCQDLEYRCFAFRELQEAYAVVQRLLIPSTPNDANPSPRKSQLKFSREFSRSSSVVELGAPSQMANWNALPLILFGRSMLTKIPSEWQDNRFFLALTSHAEDFEDVGRLLLASGETEIRERLRSKGISEYLFHPLSMNAMRGTVRQMVRAKLGDEYLLVDTLGRGAFGVVYRAKRLRDGEVFALKEISLRRQAKAAKQEANIEPTMLKSLSWPTVVGLVDEWISRKDQVQYLLMTVLLGGNIHQQIETAKDKDLVISPDRWLEWYAQTLHAVCYLHWKGVLHRDIKPANLFLAADFRALLVGDLGSAARLPGTGPHPSPHSSVPGVVTTVAYSSPEVFTRKVFYAASDLWSLGVSFFQVLTLKYPHVLPEFADQDPNLVDPSTLGVNAHTVLQEMKISGSDGEKVTQELLQMLRADPMERPSATSIAAQPYIKQCLEPVLALPDHPSKQYFTTPEKHLAVFDRLLFESRIANVNSFRPSTQNLKSGSTGSSGSDYVQLLSAGYQSHDYVKI